MWMGCGVWARGGRPGMIDDRLLTADRATGLPGARSLLSVESLNLS